MKRTRKKHLPKWLADADIGWIAKEIIWLTMIHMANRTGFYETLRATKPKVRKQMMFEWEHWTKITIEAWLEQFYAMRGVKTESKNRQFYGLDHAPSRRLPDMPRLPSRRKFEALRNKWRKEPQMGQSVVGFVKVHIQEPHQTVRPKKAKRILKAA